MATTSSAQTVARWFVEWAHSNEADLSNLKLQKLLYFAQGEYLARTGGHPLFADRIDAWQHGPVVKEIYHDYKSFGTGDVTPDDSHPFEWDDVDDETAQFLIQVWNTYGGFGAWRLRNITHEQPPWRDVFEPNRPNIEISQQSMLDFFSAN